MKRRSSTNPRSVESLLAVIETLRRGPAGAELLTQIDQGQQLRDGLIDVVERTFLSFLQNAMTRHERRSGTDPTTRLKSKMIARRAAALATTETQEKEVSLHDTAALEQHLMAMLWAAGEAKAREIHLSAHTAKPDNPALTAPSGNHEELRPLTRALAQQLDGATSRSADNIAQIKAVAASLKHAGAMEEVKELRDILRDALHELLESSKTLDDHLRQARYSTSQLAFKTGTAAQTLGAASLDRNTLLQRVGAEARRAERYRHPLSLALLGPDHIGDIDRLVGPNAGREVLRRYLESITSCARAYDVVAHCHPHGLVWLLPATATPQGMQALRKVQQHIAGKGYQFGGHHRPLPTFSGALISYVSGETPAAFLARAETLATRAKSGGPNRIEAESRPTP